MTRKLASGLLLLASLTAASCGPLIGQGNPRPGSLEDCVAWSFAAAEAAPDDVAARFRLASHLENHYMFARSTGSRPRAILTRQKALLAFGRARPRRPGDSAVRAKCLAQHPLKVPG